MPAASQGRQRGREAEAVGQETVAAVDAQTFAEPAPAETILAHDRFRCGQERVERLDRTRPRATSALGDALADRFEEARMMLFEKSVSGCAPSNERT